MSKADEINNSVEPVLCVIDTSQLRQQLLLLNKESNRHDEHYKDMSNRIDIIENGAMENSLEKQRQIESLKEFGICTNNKVETHSKLHTDTSATIELLTDRLSQFEQQTASSLELLEHRVTISFQRQFSELGHSLQQNSITASNELQAHQQLVKTQFEEQQLLICDLQKRLDLSDKTASEEVSERKKAINGAMKQLITTVNNTEGKVRKHEGMLAAETRKIREHLQQLESLVTDVNQTGRSNVIEIDNIKEHVSVCQLLIPKVESLQTDQEAIKKNSSHQHGTLLKQFESKFNNITTKTVQTAKRLENTLSESIQKSAAEITSQFSELLITRVRDITTQQTAFREKVKKNVEKMKQNTVVVINQFKEESDSASENRDKTVSRLKSEFEDITERISQTQVEVEKRLIDVSSKLSENRGEIRAVEDRCLAITSSRVDEIARQLHQLSEDSIDLNGHVETISASQKTALSKTNNTFSEIALLQDTLQTHETESARLTCDINRIKSLDSSLRKEISTTVANSAAITKEFHSFLNLWGIEKHVLTRSQAMCLSDKVNLIHSTPAFISLLCGQQSFQSGGGSVDDVKRRRQLEVGFTVRGEYGRRGAEICNITPGSPAALAGFRLGDRVLYCNGSKVDTDYDLSSALGVTTSPDLKITRIPLGSTAPTTSDLLSPQRNR